MTTFPKKFFVTGTDTDAGKTVIASMLCVGLKADYWKPVQSGTPTDSEALRQIIGSDRVHPEGVVLSQPLSPNQAAEKDRTTIELSQLVLPETTNHLVVEGAGGLFVPINQTQTMFDLIIHLGLPVILTARTGLGTLNHTLLSVEAMRNRKIPLLGVILNGPEHRDNARDIEAFGKVPILGRVPVLPELNQPNLEQCFQSMQKNL